MAIFVGILILLFLDQLSKFLASSYLIGSQGYEIIPDFFRLIYVENRGAAFGMLQDSRSFFIIVTIFVVSILSYYLFRKKNQAKGISRIALMLILGGTLGNFIDRVRLSYVVDFISFRFLNWNFAVFNLADSFIVCGTILLVYKIIKEDDSHA